jgi:tripartite-type tricarboxylate transporter receptor subunit TctC
MALALATLLPASLRSAAADEAADYPSRPIRLVVPYPPGSLPDTLGRAIADQLQAAFKQPVVVDNRAGSSTLIGAKAVAAAAPDGYTLMVPTVTTFSLAPQLLTKSGVDPVKELTPIARIGATNFILCVTPSFPARTMKEWIAAVRKDPGKYTYASSGIGSPHHIFMETLKRQLGLDIVHVPYKSTVLGMTDLLSQKVDMAFLDGTLASANFKSGKLFGLGTSMARRSTAVPEIPPIAETVPGFDWSGWIAFAGPAHMPPAIVDKVAAEVHRIVATPQYAELLGRATMEPVDWLSPAELGEFVRHEYQRWGPAIKNSGATVE